VVFATTFGGFIIKKGGIQSMSITSLLLGKSRKKKIGFFVPHVRNRDVIDIGCAGGSDKPYDKEDWIHNHMKS
jgi:hypothetical protein